MYYWNTRYKSLTDEDLKVGKDISNTILLLVCETISRIEIALTGTTARSRDLDLVLEIRGLKSAIKELESYARRRDEDANGNTINNSANRIIPTDLWTFSRAISWAISRHEYGKTFPDKKCLSDKIFDPENEKLALFRGMVLDVFSRARKQISKIIISDAGLRSSANPTGIQFPLIQSVSNIFSMLLV